MSLAVRNTGLASPTSQGWADLTIYDADRPVGRVYQDRRAQLELRLFWSITMLGARHADIKTDGRAATLEEANAQCYANWRKFLVWAKLEVE